MRARSVVRRAPATPDRLCLSQGSASPTGESIMCIVFRQYAGRGIALALGSGVRIPYGRAELIAETFGEDRGHPSFRVGMRYWPRPDRVQIDAANGDSFGGAFGERGFSAGLRPSSMSFLPEPRFL